MRTNHRKLSRDSAPEPSTLSCPYECSPSPAVQPPDSPADHNDPFNDSHQKDHHHHPINRTTTIITSVFISAFVLTILFTILYRSRKHSARRRLESLVRPQQEFTDENRGPEIDHHIWYINTIGLDRSVIDSISVFKYKKDESLIDGTECSVCLSQFEDNEVLKLLPKCSHAFHVPCIDAWLRAHKNCPVCRAPVVCGPGVAQASSELNLRDLTSRNETRVGESSNGIRAQEFNLSVDEIPIEVESSILLDPRIVSDFVEIGLVFSESEEPIRRSVSLDPSTANGIAYTVCEKDQESFDLDSAAKNSRSKNGPNRSSSSSSESLRFDKLRKSSSVGACSLEKGPIAIKRSFSLFN